MINITKLFGFGLARLGKARLGLGPWSLVVLAVGLAMVLIAAPGCQGGDQDSMPPSQREFQRVLIEFKDKYESGTSLSRNTAKSSRGERLKSIMQGNDYRFDRWEATVLNVESSLAVGLFIPKKALTLTVSVGTMGELANTSPSVGSNLQPQAITEDSPLYALVSGLSRGEKIRVSGRFLIDANRTPLETSFKAESALVKPKFAAEFTKIETN